MHQARWVICDQKYFFITFISHSWPCMLVNYVLIIPHAPSTLSYRRVHYLLTYLLSNHLHLLPIYLWYLPIYVSHLSLGKKITNICKIGYQKKLLFNMWFDFRIPFQRIYANTSSPTCFMRRCLYSSSSHPFMF
jgi:hypothetical protein